MSRTGSPEELRPPLPASVDERGEGTPLQRARWALGAFASLGGIVLLTAVVSARAQGGVYATGEWAAWTQMAAALSLLGLAASSRWWVRSAWHLYALDLVTALLLAGGIALAALRSGNPTSAVFLILALLLLCRALLVPTPLSRTAIACVTAWAVYAVALISTAAAGDVVAMAWRRSASVSRFVFSNFAILGAAGLGIMVRALLLARSKADPKTYGARVGRLELLRHLGEDGMGQVFHARHEGLGRECAVRITNEADRGDVRASARFRRACSVAARLSHPGIVQVYDLDRLPDGRLYCAMEMLFGRTLEALVEKYGPMPAARVVHVLDQLCEAVAFTHEQRLVHGNLTPASVFLTRRGAEYDVARLTDLSLSREFGSPVDAGSHTGKKGSLFEGDANFIAPEVVLGAKADPRSDIYSLAALGYYLLAGRPLFPLESTSAVLMAQISEDPVGLASAAQSYVPPDVDTVITQGLSKLPHLRYRSVRKFQSALLGCRSAHEWGSVDAKKWWTSVPALGEAVARHTQEPREQTIPTLPDIPGLLQ